MSTKSPARITPSHLENVALHYLERFASSSSNLRRVLVRRIQRSSQHWGDDPQPGLEAMEQVINKLTRLGYLDDARYAQSKAGWLRAKGASVRKIQAGLAAKGVAADLIAAAVTEVTTQEGGDEESAAWILARKRRIGPYRQQDRALFRQRDLAVLGRAGFSYYVAAAVIDAAEPQWIGDIKP